MFLKEPDEFFKLFVNKKGHAQTDREYITSLSGSL